ncbi:MAG: SDR family oxidoreductase [Steroidobacteraceae bacterium]|nr:SDR family oxidoreductase [Steroidobacteraceae bacterium]
MTTTDPGLAAQGRTGRLAGKVALITGAGGNFGETIVRRYLEEGARVVMVGRKRAKLEATLARIEQTLGWGSRAALILPFDASDPGQARLGVETVVQELGRLDVLVNNAGSTGPKQPLGNVPLTREEVEALRAAGSNDTETVRDAISNLFGLTWNMCRAASPHLQPGSSIVNVSTIFSRTRYYGRAPYVVPKAALNTFSRHLALQLGPRGIRVNVVYPGPIESERIHNVFAAMDGLKKVPPGTTAQDFLATMALSRGEGPAGLQPVFPSIDDVANAIVFLGSDESRAFSAHGFEVTNGMNVWQESRSTLLSRPDLRTLDGDGTTVLVAAGDQIADALAIARVQAGVGAHVLLGLGSEEGVQAARAALARDDVDDPDADGRGGRDRRIEPVLFDRSRAGTLHAVLSGSQARASDKHGALHGAIVLPAYGAYRFRGALTEVGDTDVDNFLTTELAGAISVARELTRFWKETAPRGAAPRAVFMSNGDDGAGNAYADILRAAIEELIRVWRDESEMQVNGGDRAAVEWSNQILRFSSPDAESLPFSAGQAARLLFMKRRIPQICLYAPVNIAEVTGAQRSVLGWTEALTGLHLGKCVLITGGSAGIGGQLARLLAIAGAKVMITARRAEPLLEMRASIVRELEDIGYYQPGDRVQVLADVDVGSEAAMKLALEATLRAFGRIDYLVNNAGVAGAEQMVVDLDPEAWRATLQSNLNSNYSLIEKVVPLMKAQGSGYILNVSSYFGGEKYIAVPYPNRADYAVSKAGQRALVENLARFVGPEIQINAIAPGPVDGQRLKGKEGKAGLFDRRARLIIENRRLNGVHGAVLQALEQGVSLDAVFNALSPNDVGLLAHSGSAPEPLRAFAMRVAAEGGNRAAPTHSSLRFLMTHAIADRLVHRLRNGCILVDPLDVQRAQSWVGSLPEPPPPFVDPEAVRAEAGKIRTGVLGMLHLRRMPTETDVALATVFFMADRAISGETFEPSGGLQQERTITERELFGRAKPERVRRMEGETIWFVGEHMAEPVAAAARLFLAEGHVGSVMMLTRTQRRGEAIRAALGRALGHDRVTYLAVGDDLEAGLDRAFQSTGKPAAVICTPFAPLPTGLFGVEGEERLNAAGFAALVEANLTHHFRVARKVSLFKGTRLILCSPDVPVGGTIAQFALANFVKTTLHALTATLGVENERLHTYVPVNQVNLTRRMRSEEPRDAAEQAEEYGRFAHAVLLAAAPLAEAQESRYRARIYRGLAITV